MKFQHNLLYTYGHNQVLSELGIAKAMEFQSSQWAAYKKEAEGIDL